MSFNDPPSQLERFDNYEAELRLLLADTTQQLDLIQSQTGDARKTTLTRTTSTLSEATDLLGSMRLEISSLPTSLREKAKKRLRDGESDVDASKRKLASLSSDRSKLFGGRYRDTSLDGGDGGPQDEQLAQRQQLLSGTERLTRSSARLTEAQRIANETEGIGAGVLRDLAGQREQIVHSRDVLLESEGYTDRSIKTLRGMARRWGLPFS